MPPQFQRKIAAILPPHPDNGKDELAGAGGQSAGFSVSHMYNNLCDYNNREEADPVWHKIWKLCVLERIRIFIWRARWNRLLTNSLKHRMGLSSPLCLLWIIEETSLHVLRDCDGAIK